MSKKCKDIEEKAKTLLKTDLLKAKDGLINAAECYNKHYKKKNYTKMMEKAAKALEDYAKPLDPFEARKHVEEAVIFLEKINRKEKCKSIMVSLADKFYKYAKDLKNNYTNLAHAIKYVLAAEQLYLEYDEEEKYHDCTIFAYTICEITGIPLGKIAKLIQKDASQVK